MTTASKPDNLTKAVLKYDSVGLRGTSSLARNLLARKVLNLVWDSLESSNGLPFNHEMIYGLRIAIEYADGSPELRDNVSALVGAYNRIAVESGDRGRTITSVPVYNTKAVQLHSGTGRLIDTVFKSVYVGELSVGEPDGESQESNYYQPELRLIEGGK